MAQTRAQLKSKCPFWYLISVYVFRNKTGIWRIQVWMIHHWSKIPGVSPVVFASVGSLSPAFNVSLRGKGSSISCAALREAPPPPRHGYNYREKGCISWPWKGPLQPCLVCWHSQTKVNKSRVALADLLPRCCKQWLSPHVYSSHRRCLSVGREIWQHFQMYIFQNPSLIIFEVITVYWSWSQSSRLLLCF